MAFSFGAAPAALPAREPIDIVCARCANPFFTALTDYTLAPPPSAPPRLPHAHVLTRTEQSSTLHGGRGAVCNGCAAPIGTRPSYGCAPCAFDLCDSCARPPQRAAAAMRTSSNPLLGSLRVGARAAAWDCAACARPAEAAAQWTVDSGTGLVPMLGASLTVAIGDGEARIVASARSLQPPPAGAGAVPSAGEGNNNAPAGIGAGHSLGVGVVSSGGTMAGFLAPVWPPMPLAHARADGAALLRARDLSFELLCDKKLGDLEDLGRGQHHCADCRHTVTEVKTWGEYAAMARAGRCVAAHIIDPENAHLVPAAAVRVSA